MFKLISRLLTGHGPRDDSAPEAMPSSAEEWKKQGNALFGQHRIEEALACYRRALSIDPAYADAEWNSALGHLMLGNYLEGFALYESRFRGGGKNLREFLRGVLSMMSGKPVWTGERLQGERLLIWTEQGLGDALMFLRFLPQAAASGARLVVACEAQLVRIVSALPGVERVFSKDAPLPLDEFDLHCSLLSLPHCFGTSLDTLPKDVPYLPVPPPMADRWSARLAGISGLKVGLVWAGSAQLDLDTLRSLALARLAPLAQVPGVALVSLQKGEPSGQLEEFGWPVVDWMDECSDLLDTAALVANLDLVVSVDTAVAHLAGALGKPVWLLNRYESEWRWMLDRKDSPWYPTLRIFRQPEPHDWDSVIAEVTRELQTLAGHNHMLSATTAANSPA